MFRYILAAGLALLAAQPAGAAIISFDLKTLVWYSRYGLDVTVDASDLAATFEYRNDEPFVELLSGTTRIRGSGASVQDQVASVAKNGPASIAITWTWPGGHNTLEIDFARSVIFPVLTELEVGQSITYEKEVFLDILEDTVRLIYRPDICFLEGYGGSDECYYGTAYYHGDFEFSGTAVSFAPTTVPLPTPVASLATGLAAIIFLRRMRSAADAA